MFLIDLQNQTKNNEEKIISTKFEIIIYHKSICLDEKNKKYVYENICECFICKIQNIEDFEYLFHKHFTKLKKYKYFEFSKIELEYLHLCLVYLKEKLILKSEATKKRSNKLNFLIKRETNLSFKNKQYELFCILFLYFKNNYNYNTNIIEKYGILRIYDEIILKLDLSLNLMNGTIGGNEKADLSKSIYILNLNENRKLLKDSRKFIIKKISILITI